MLNGPMGADFENNQSSIEGLEQQLMAAVESPKRRNDMQELDKRPKDSLQNQSNDFQFDSQDDIFQGMELI